MGQHYGTQFVRKTQHAKRDTAGTRAHVRCCDMLSTAWPFWMRDTSAISSHPPLFPAEVAWPRGWRNPGRDQGLGSRWQGYDPPFRWQLLRPF